MKIVLTQAEVENLIKQHVDDFTDGGVETVEWHYGSDTFVVCVMEEVR